jgi:hypothetical protein
MFKLLKKILVLSIAILVVLTTGGFKVYSHQCDCCHTTELSLTDFDDCCELDEAMAVCEADGQAEACCQDETHDAHENHSCEADHCCQIESEFYKLDNAYEKANALQIHAFQFVKKLEQIIYTESQQLDFVDKLIFVSGNAPPKLSSRLFVVFSHSLKIPF